MGTESMVSGANHEKIEKHELLSSLIDDKRYKELKHELLAELLNDKALREKLVKTLVSHVVICGKCGEIVLKEKTKIAEHDNKHYCFTCYYGKA